MWLGDAAMGKCGYVTPEHPKRVGTLSSPWPQFGGSISAHMYGSLQGTLPSDAHNPQQQHGELNTTHLPWQLALAAQCFPQFIRCPRTWEGIAARQKLIRNYAKAATDENDELTSDRFNRSAICSWPTDISNADLHSARLC